MRNGWEFSVISFSPRPARRVFQSEAVARRRHHQMLSQFDMHDVHLERRQVGWWVTILQLVEGDTVEMIDDEPEGANEYVVRYQRAEGHQHQEYFEARQLALDFIQRRLLPADPDPKWAHLGPIIDLRVQRRLVGPWEPIDV